MNEAKHETHIQDLVQGLVQDDHTYNGYFGYPFAKLTTWSFTIFLFFFEMWYSIVEVTGKFF